MRVLIAARTTESAEALARFLTAPDAEIRTASDGMTIRAIDLSGFDLIFLSIPLAGESGVRLLAEIREKTDAHLFALVKKERAAELRKNGNPRRLCNSEAAFQRRTRAGVRLRGAESDA